MELESIHCRSYPFDSDTYREAVQWRETVLREPLGLAWTARDFEAEEVSYHLGAFRGGRLVGTLILRPREAGVLQMRQVAVAPEAQGHGVGAALVRYGEAYAATRGYTTITAHARMAVVGFYRKLGYQVVGEPFVEVGITKALASVVREAAPLSLS